MSCRGIRINCAPHTMAGRDSQPSLQPFPFSPGTTVVCLRYITAAWSDQQHQIMRCSTPYKLLDLLNSPWLVLAISGRLSDLIALQATAARVKGKLSLKGEDYSMRKVCYLRGIIAESIKVAPRMFFSKGTTVTFRYIHSKVTFFLWCSSQKRTSFRICNYVCLCAVFK